MRKLGISAVLSLLVTALAAVPALAAGTPVFDPTAVPNGTHVQTGSPSCAFGPGPQDVTCSAYELAGVGNRNATATLTATYSATIDCRNGGGNIVAVKTGTFTDTSTTGRLSPKNGRLPIPELTVTAPSEEEFLAKQRCPNRNWTPEIQEGTTITLDSSLYTLVFDREGGMPTSLSSTRKQ
ncbi:MAG TPA: hypothetical protein VK902_18520 [Rubrobacter sp.]|nr:hypothetical protein [Rubrobacter sp.]